MNARTPSSIVIECKLTVAMAYLEAGEWERMDKELEGIMSIREEMKKKPKQYFDEFPY